MAFDLFIIPAMSLKCEQSCSIASNTISTWQSNLLNNIVENGKVLYSWVSASIVKLGALSSSITNMT